MYTESALLGMLVAGALAAPAPQSIPTCNMNTEYSEVKISEPYNLPPERLSGYGCKSHKDDGCSLGTSASHTITITQTVNGGAAAGLDLSKIYHLGLDAGYSYSWATSDAKSASSSVDCPKGFIICGMQVTPKVVKITGKQTIKKFGCIQGDGDYTSDFEVVAPNRKGTGNEDMTADQIFEACMSECSDGDGSCKAATDQGVPKCP